MAEPRSAVLAPRTKSHLLLAGDAVRAAWRTLTYLPLGLANLPLTVWVLLATLSEEAGKELDLEPFLVFAGLMGLHLALGARGAVAQTIAAQVPARTVRPVLAPKLLERIGLKTGEGPRRGAPEPAPPPSRRRLWTLSGGLFPAALALFVLRAVLVGATLALLVALPVTWLDQLHSDFWQLAWQLPLAPLILLGVGYVLVVDCSIHLALQSLAANRRGAGSAMQHAWRLATLDVPSMAKGATLHLVGLGAPLLAFAIAYAGPMEDELMPSALVAVGVGAFFSNTLSHYWARSYQRMGGIHTAQPARVRGRGPNPGSAAHPG